MVLVVFITSFPTRKVTTWDVLAEKGVSLGTLTFTFWFSNAFFLPFFLSAIRRHLGLAEDGSGRPRLLPPERPQCRYQLLQLQNLLRRSSRRCQPHWWSSPSRLSTSSSPSLCSRTPARVSPLSAIASWLIVYLFIYLVSRVTNNKSSNLLIWAYPNC